MHWYVYIVHCSDDSLYTGITTDVAKRFSAHASSRGAKYFRGREPEAVLYIESGHDRSSASQREAAIKKLTKAAKRRLINSTCNELSQPLAATDLSQAWPSITGN